MTTPAGRHDHWTALTSDPNSGEALALRRAAITSAKVTLGVDRVEYLVELTRGKAILDVGCVDHDFEGAEVRVSWLHRRLAAAARSTLGIDVRDADVAKMREQGYNVLVHDITGDPAALQEHGPFEVMVAGEVIEHLSSPGSLFTTAREVLSPGGQLVITTPNPFAPWRARAGQLGIVWENVDHIAYFPPSGVVELADRAGGLRLVQIAVDRPERAYSVPPLHGALASLKQLLTRKREYRREPFYPVPLESAVGMVRRQGLLGETIIYVFERVEAPPA